MLRPRTGSEVITAVFVVSNLSSKVGSLSLVKIGLKNTITATAASITFGQLVLIALTHLIVPRMEPTGRHPSQGWCSISCSIASAYCFRSIDSHASEASPKQLCVPSC